MKKLKSVTKVILTSAVLMSLSGCLSNDLPSELESFRKPREVSFNRGWKFLKLDIDDKDIDGYKVSFDDSNWRKLDLPHDWAIAGPFTKKVSSAEGRLPFPGIGWYRKSFKAPASDKRVFVEFDGVMKNAKVWVNGRKVGQWPYGYSSFSFELTPHLKYDKPNVIAVRCDNQAESSRWYPGSGIYRNVRLVITNPVHVAHWGTYITTPQVSEKSATIKIRTKIRNQTANTQNISIENIILGADGRKIVDDKVSAKLSADSIKTLQQELTIDGPTRWDINNPYLYEAITLVKSGDKLLDEYRTSFGIRTFRFDTEEGFFLNGRNMKIHGVNLHHGLGPIGTAVNKRAIERQLEIIKGMGCNAVRTAHNPPAPELLDLCDTMGILVLDEAFDEWHRGKVPNGYHTIFDDWAEKDLRAMIQRDKNHPSIILWSIGNEIPALGTKRGVKIAHSLSDICRQEDPTRPVTIGNSARYENVKDAVEALDVVGWNYRSNTREYDEPQKRHLKQLATETCALVSSRGEYLFPVEKNMGKHKDGQVSSYDLTNLSFGGLPDDEFRVQQECPFVAGEFVWSGFDYLGEPEPCEGIARSTYFGIVDLCGFLKDRYYLYQSQWTDEPMVHLLPHWNWPGREGDITPVFCYTNCQSAELFVNGRSMGKKHKQKGIYRFKWEDVTYQPGAVKAIAYNKDGKAVCSTEIKTAGPAAQIELTADRDVIDADGKDLSFVTVKILDEKGLFCPIADNKINFTVQGPAEIYAVGNGDTTNYESFKAEHHKAFNGLCLLVIRSEPKAGRVKITAASDGLKSASKKITTVIK